MGVKDSIDKMLSQAADALKTKGTPIKEDRTRSNSSISGSGRSLPASSPTKSVSKEKNSAGNSTIKGAKTQNVARNTYLSTKNPLVSNKEHGINTTKANSSVFAEDDLTAGNTSLYDKYKNNLGIDEENRISDFSNIHKTKAVNSETININNIESKFYDSTVDNAIKAYNARNVGVLSSNPNMAGSRNPAVSPVKTNAPQNVLDSILAPLGLKASDKASDKQIGVLGAKVSPQTETRSESIVLPVDANGRAVKGGKAGDFVPTQGGGYKILGVDAYGNYITDAKDKSLHPTLDLNTKANLSNYTNIPLGTIVRFKDTGYSQIVMGKNADGSYIMKGVNDIGENHPKVVTLYQSAHPEATTDKYTDQIKNPSDRKTEEVTLSRGQVKEKEFWENNKKVLNEGEALYYKASKEERDRLGSALGGETLYSQREKEYAEKHPYLSAIDAGGGAGIQAPPTQAQKTVEGLTGQEQKIYNYLYNKKGLKYANKWLDAKQYEVNQRRSEEASASGQQTIKAKGGKTLASVGSVVTNMAGGVAFASNELRGIKNKLGIGKYKPVDPNSDLNTFTRVGNEMRSSVRESIKNPALRFMYDGAMSIADMGTAQTIFGVSPKLVTYALASASGQATIVDSLEKGATQEQALFNGLVNAGLEYISETPAVEGLFKFTRGEKGVVDLGTLASALGRQMATEAIGESFANVTQTISDAVILGNLSNWGQTQQQYEQSGYTPYQAFMHTAFDLLGKDTLYNAALGGVTGFGLGGASIAVNHVSTGNYIKNDTDYAKDLVKTANDVLSKKNDAKLLDVAKRLENGDKVKAIEAANLKNAVQNYYAEKCENDIKEIYSYVGLEYKEPNRLAKAYQIAMGRDGNEFSNDRFTEAWAQKSIETFYKAQLFKTYKGKEREALKNELEEYMENADMLLWSNKLSEDGRASGRVRALVNDALNGINASAAGTDPQVENSKEILVNEDTESETAQIDDVADKTQADEQTVENEVNIAENEAQAVTDTIPQTEVEEENIEEPVTASAENEEPASVEVEEPVTASADNEGQATVTAQSVEESEPVNEPVTENRPVEEQKEAVKATGQTTAETLSNEASEPNKPVKKVGKETNGGLVFHKSYEENNDAGTNEIWDVKNTHNIDDSEYDFIKQNEDGTIRFIKVDDFNGKAEPKVVSIITVDTDGEMSTDKPVNRVIVEKSSLVADDYTGFNVQEQKAHEALWKTAVDENGDKISYNAQKLFEYGFMADEKYFNGKFGKVLYPETEKAKEPTNKAKPSEKAEEQVSKPKPSGKTEEPVNETKPSEKVNISIKHLEELKKRFKAEYPDGTKEEFIAWANNQSNDTGSKSLKDKNWEDYVVGEFEGITLVKVSSEEFNAIDDFYNRDSPDSRPDNMITVIDYPDRYSTDFESTGTDENKAAKQLVKALNKMKVPAHYSVKEINEQIKSKEDIFFNNGSKENAFYVEYLGEDGLYLTHIYYKDYKEKDTTKAETKPSKGKTKPSESATENELDAKLKGIAKSLGVSIIDIAKFSETNPTQEEFAKWAAEQYAKKNGSKGKNIRQSRTVGDIDFNEMAQELIGMKDYLHELYLDYMEQLADPTNEYIEVRDMDNLDVLYSAVFDSTFDEEDAENLSDTEPDVEAEVETVPNEAVKSDNISSEEAMNRLNSKESVGFTDSLNNTYKLKYWENEGKGFYRVYINGAKGKLKGKHYIDLNDYEYHVKDGEELETADEIRDYLVDFMNGKVKEKEDVSRYDNGLHEGTEPESVPGVQEKGNVGDLPERPERLGGREMEGDSSEYESELSGERTVQSGPEGRPVNNRHKDRDDEVRSDSGSTRSVGVDNNAGRFYIDRGLVTISSPYSRIDNNIAAIRTLKTLQNENRKATMEEKEILSKFTGWGGLNSELSSGSARAETVKELLTVEEYQSVALATDNAYYTPPEVVDAVYEIAERMGLGGNAKILEQSCGSGRFFGYMPKELRESSSITGVELDKVAGEIAKYLYDDVDIRVQNYNEFNEGGYNLIVGNVPFSGDVSVYDKNYKSESNEKIHNYFIRKGIEQLNAGGIMIVVTSHSTLDTGGGYNKNGKPIEGTKLAIARRANLIGAIRLPSEAFNGTNVVTDILILQKKGPGVDDSLAQKFNGTVKKELRNYRTRKNVNVSYNEYFDEHPEMVMGDMYAYSDRFGKDALGVSGYITSEDFSNVIANLPKNIYTKALREQHNIINSNTEAAEAENIVSDEKRPEGLIDIKDGVVYERAKGKWIPFKPTIKKGGKEVLDTDRLDRIKAMHELMLMRDELLQLEKTSDDDEAVNKAIKAISDKYDAFVDKYGFINNNKNLRAYGTSPNLGKLTALEEVEEKVRGVVKKASKGDILKKRVATPRRIPSKAKSVQEGLRISLGLKYAVDIDYIVELTGKSKEDVISELGDKIFMDPVDRKYVLDEEYLSGNVRQKLAIAEQAMNDDPSFARNVKALRDVLPADLLPEQIEVKLGSAWVDPEIFAEFADKKLFIGYPTKVEYNPVDSSYKVTNHYAYKFNGRWGTSEVPALTIFEAALNDKPIIIKNDGMVDTKATAKAQAKVDEVQSEFASWVWTNAERREVLQNAYNEKFNNYVERQIDISYLPEKKTFAGQNGGVVLKAHQIKASLKAIYQKATLFVHSVGAGKTFALISAANEMKRLGIANKPLMVVPNAKVVDFANDYKLLYPAANVLIVGDSDFKPETINSTLAKIEQYDYDCIIMRSSSFDRFPLTVEAMEEYKASELAKYRMSIANNPDMDKQTIKDIETAINKYEQKLDEMIDNARDNSYGIEVFFDKCGIDALLMDEAHEYKNLFFPSRNKIAGIGGNKPTIKTTHLHMITQLMHKRGNHIVFATATPTTNSLSEFYTMQRYLQPDKLHEAGIDSFDAWMSVFGEAVTKAEMNTTGQKMRVKTRFAKLKNIPDLMRIMRQAFDFVDGKDIDLSTPEGRIFHVKAPSSALLFEVNNRIDKGAAILDKNGKTNTLANYTLAKMASMDLRLARKKMIELGIIPEDTEDSDLDLPDSKVNKAVAKIYEEYENSKDISGTQLVFLDKGIPKKYSSQKSDSTEEDEEEAEIAKVYDFDLYSDIKKKLILRGIPENEIAFIHDFDTDEKKRKLDKLMNDGKIRVLIGSTKKAGTGINVQQRAVAIHHLDAPQRPADLIQRNGRAIRQKNLNDIVNVYYYSTLNSYDAPMWEMLNRKSKGIEAVMRGDVNIREFDDSSLDDTFQNMSIASANNPELFRMQDIQEQLKRLEAERGNFASRRSANEDIVANYSNKKATQETVIANYNLAKAKADETAEDVYRVGKEVFETAKKASLKAYEAVAKERYAFTQKVIGNLNGFTVLATKTNESASENEFMVTLEGVPWVGAIKVSFNDAKGNKLSHSKQTIAAANMFEHLSKRLKNDYQEKYDKVTGKLADLEREYADAQKDLAEGRDWNSLPSTSEGFRNKGEEFNILSEELAEIKHNMLEAANDNRITIDVSALWDKDFSERIPTEEVLEEQIGVIPKGKGRDEWVKQNKEKTAKEKAQEKAKEIAKSTKTKKASEKGDKKVTKASEKHEARVVRPEQRSADDVSRPTQSTGNFVERTTGDNNKYNEAVEEMRNGDVKNVDSLMDIVREIGKRFKINIHNKKQRMRSATMGFFESDHRFINLRYANDLGTLCHEIGHAIDKTTKLSKLQAVKDILGNAPKLNKNLESAGYPEAEKNFEVVAEFTWQYLNNPDGAWEMGSYAKGENFYDTFERVLAENKMLDDLKAVRSMILKFASKSPVDSIASTIHTGEEIRRKNKSSISQLIDSFKTSIIASTSIAEKIDKKIEKANGKKLDNSERLELAMEFIGDSASVTNELITNRFIDPNMNITAGVRSFADILKSLEENCKHIDRKNFLKEFEVYLLARHSIDWENRGKFTMNSNIAAGQYAEDNDIHQANIAKYASAIADLEDKYGDTFIKHADELNDWWRLFMQTWAVDTGLMSSDLWENLKAMYPHYVPQFRVMDKANSTRHNSSKSINNELFKRSNEQGSQRERYSPIENMLIQANNIVKAHYMNQLGMKIHKLYNNPDDDVKEVMGNFFVRVDMKARKENVDMRGIKEQIKDAMMQKGYDELSVPEQMAIDAMSEADKLIALSNLADVDLIDTVISDTITKFVPTTIGLSDNVIACKLGDRTVYYECLDENFARALKNNSSDELWFVVKMLGKSTRFFSKITTSANLLFAITNAIRDWQHGFIYTEPKYKWDTLNLMYLIDYPAALFSALKGNAFNGRWAGEAVKMYRTINGYNSKYIPGVDTYGKTINEVMGSQRTILGRLGRIINMPFRFTEYLNESIEMAPRLVAGKRALAHTKGRSAEERWKTFMTTTRESTVNFHKKGTMVRKLGYGIPFIGASIAGLEQFRKLVMSKETYTTKKGLATLARALALQTTLALIAALNNYRDDDREKEYEHFTDYIKLKYWNVKIGNTWIRLPKDHEIGGLYGNAAQIVIASLMLDEFDTKEEAKKAFSNLVETCMISADVTFLSSISDARADKTWYGGSITSYNDDGYIKAKQYEKISDESTSLIADHMAQMLSHLPKDVREYMGVALSGKGIDYLLDQNLGWLADFALPITTPTEKGDTVWQTISSVITNKYVTNHHKSNQYVNDAYDIYYELQAAEIDFAGGTSEFRATPEGKWLTAFEKGIKRSGEADPDSKTVNDWRADIRALKVDTSIPFSERQEKINECYDHIGSIMQRLVEDYRQNNEPTLGDYADMIVPKSAQQAGLTEESYRPIKEASNKYSSKEGQFLSIMRSGKLTQEQIDGISEKYAGTTYVSSKRKGYTEKKRKAWADAVADPNLTEDMLDAFENYPNKDKDGSGGISSKEAADICIEIAGGNNDTAKHLFKVEYPNNNYPY